MKITFVDSMISEEVIGGAQTFLSVLTKGLAARGHEITLLTRGNVNTSVREAVAESGVEVHSDLRTPGTLVEETTPVLADWIDGRAPDVFVVSVSPDAGWTVLPYLGAMIATVAIGHTDSDTFYLPARHYAKFLTRAIAVSPEIGQSYSSQSGIVPDRVEVIPYGVESDPRPPEYADGNAIRLIYVGRIEEEQKRISDLVQVVKRLTAAQINFEIEFVGDGAQMPAVRDLLKGELSSGIVGLSGWLGADRVIASLRSSETFLLASEYEGFCIALTEAMANGCCPIVTDIRSGNKQLIADGVNGFIVPVGDVDAFVDRIKRLDSDREMLLRMRRAAWETGRQYSVERMVDAYEQCFERAIEDALANPRTPDPNFPLMPSCRSKYPLWARRIKAKAKQYLSTK